ncbi:MAG TPA: DPP IV N-terminal domain-containing protein, partial [Candidatus Limnocylindria bacterium]
MAWPTLADLARLPLPGTDGPIEVRFAPDGSALTYLAGEPGSQVRSLWRHDLGAGERVLLAGPAEASTHEETLSVEEQLQRERRRTGSLGITEYAWAPRAEVPAIVAPTGGWVLAAVGEAVRLGPMTPIPGVEGASATALSPDGLRLAFVRDADAWVAPVTGDGDPRRLTSDAEDGVSNGLADYAASEELGRFEGLWWSWDGGRLAMAHVDEREVPITHIPHLGEEAAARHESHRYPYAGGPNARVSLRIASAGEDGCAEVRLPDAGEGGYLARVVAHPQGGWLVATLPRHQRELHWSRLATDGTLTPLWTEAVDPWVDMDDDTRVLADGRVLRSTERTGFRHLELHEGGDGDPRQLTSGEWMVTRVVHVDERRGVAYFLATRHGAIERHLYRVALDAPRPVEDPERLTTEPGWHDVAVSQDGERWADTWSDLEHGPSLSVREAAEPSRPTVVAAPTSSAAALGVTPPELLTLIAADGETPLHAALYRPQRPAATPPPCVVWVYGGPHAQYVKRTWEVTAHPLRQYLARAGVAVLVVDNRGMAFRGTEFERPLVRGLGTAEVEDQAAAVRQLAARGEIDIKRVGITGGSYGGFMTIRAMALEPELFRVGVAVAPVTDWRGYDTAYTERYLGLPESDAEAYEASSALGVAERITGSLLLIHGAIDENVHLRHSTRLVAKLQAAGRDVELVLLPADRHRTRSASGLATRDRRTARHLLAGLGVPLP